MELLTVSPSAFNNPHDFKQHSGRGASPSRLLAAFAFYGFWWLWRTLAFSSFSMGVTALMQLPQLMLVWNCKVFIKLEEGGAQGERVRG